MPTSSRLQRREQVLADPAERTRVAGHDRAPPAGSLRERMAQDFDTVEEHEFGASLTVVLLAPRAASAPSG